MPLNEHYIILTCIFNIILYNNILTFDIQQTMTTQTC